MALAETIAAGGVALAPADTVYGFFGNALASASVSRVYDIKQRDRGKPFVLYSNAGLAARWGNLTVDAETLIDAFWPRALAVVVPRSEALPAAFTGGRENVAIMTASNALIRDATSANPDLPMFGTTVNISGEPELKTAAEVAHFAPDVDVFVADDSVPIWNKPSTIVDCCEPGAPRILRLSAVAREEIQEVLPHVV